MQSTIQQYITTPMDWDVIISSPLRRCHCFAEHLANQLGLPMRVNEHIKEMYFGDWEGISTQVIYEAEPERLANFGNFQRNIMLQKESLCFNSSNES
jgi:alpha-ribazole phosphatase